MRLARAKLVQRVDHVREVNLQLVILTGDQHQMRGFKFLAHVLRLLSQLNHKAEPKLLMLIRLRVPK